MKPKTTIITFQFDNADPISYGPFESAEAATEAVDRITADWNDTDFYHCTNGGGYIITQLQTA